VISEPRPDTSDDQPEGGAMAVFRNRPFLLLWLSQAATQVGGNMVIYGLTVIVFESTSSTAAVSALLLTFLAPAVLFSALAGVYVDRLDRRALLIVTNLIRAVSFGAIFLVGNNLALLYLLNIFVATVTTFFAPAEAAMIPVLVPRHQLLAANGIFTLTLNAAFALGFALLGPIVVNLSSPQQLILVVAALYLVAAVFCITLPSAPPAHADGVHPRQVAVDAERAVSSTFGQLREGLAYIRSNPTIGWSLIYLGVTASLIGVLGSLGPGFAQSTLGLQAKDFVVVVLPLGFGIVMGILVLNNYGRLVPRRRLIEAGLIAMGVLIALLAIVAPIARFLQRVQADSALANLQSFFSVLSIVVAIAFLTGIAYAGVAISAQTQLQEELPVEIRGRVFGVLFTLVSVASFVPIIFVGLIAGIVGTTAVLFGVAILVGAAGVASVLVPREPPVLRHAGGDHRVGPIVTPDASAIGYEGTVADPVGAVHPALPAAASATPAPPAASADRPGDDGA
jgi:MFS family permease